MASSCGNPVADSDALMTKKRKLNKSRLCLKCKTNLGNILVRNAIYCKACFFPLTTMKFRRSLEPHINVVPDGPRKKALKPGGNLLLGFSGGLGSTVLLDLVERSYFTSQDVPVAADGTAKGGRNHPRNEPIWKRTFVCYVEVCAAFPGMRDRTDDVRQALTCHSAFQVIMLRLEDAFDPEWWAKHGGMQLRDALQVDLGDEELLVRSDAGDSNLDPMARLQQYINVLPTSTAITASVQALTRVLLLYTARSTECSHLLLGTSLTSLSVSLISSISQGGGFSVHEEAQEEWRPPTLGSLRSTNESTSYAGPIRVVRPLQDINIKECAAWAWWSKLQVVGREKWPVSKQAIGSLTKAFVIGLERDYPATVSTIAKTCAKLASRGDACSQCVLCERPAQETAQAWKERISIRELDNIPQRHRASPTSSSPTLSSRLCYACHTTLTSQSSRGGTKVTQNGPLAQYMPLPSWTVAHLCDPSQDHSRSLVLVKPDEDLSATQELWATKKLETADMLARVNDFLIEE